jgi:rRNA maturation protein Nop10
MGIACPTCGRKAVRHIRNPVTLGNAISFENHEKIPFHLGIPPEGMVWWDKGDWYTLKDDCPDRVRFWLPLTDDLSYEEAMALYTLWVDECKKHGDQLVVVYVDLGRIKGAEKDPWYGSVLLGAFRGRDLDWIEPETDDDMRWLRWAYLWAADPKTRWQDHLDE